MRRCIVCQQPISSERLQALPDTTTCPEHSSEQKKIGFMVYDHKTAGVCITVSPDDLENLRLAKRADQRGR